MKTMANRLMQTFSAPMGRVAVALAFVAALMTIPATHADVVYKTGYNGQIIGSYTNGGGGYYSGGHKGGYHSGSSGRTYHYRTGYRSGGSSFGFMNFNSGKDSSTGYSGGGASDNTPHRSDWNAKLQAQRRWDEEQYKAMQTSGGVKCGLSGAPAYCYRLMGPYPQELRVVRY